jgi:quercetin dioxygenase-like cupin family protein
MVIDRTVSGEGGATMIDTDRNRWGHLAVSLVLEAGLAGCAVADRSTTGGPAAGPGKVAVRTVLTRAIPEDAGREARVLEVVYPPGGTSAPHRHPGAVIAYVAEGEVVSQLDDGAPVTYRAGESWYEAPGQLHAVSRNASATRPAKLVVFFLTRPGEPVKTDAPGH